MKIKLFLSDHINEFYAFYCRLCRLLIFKALHGFRQLFDKSMILFYSIIEIFTLHSVYEIQAPRQHDPNIHIAVDGFGLPIDVKIMGGEVHDSKIAPEFISELPIAEYLTADRGYDHEKLRERIRQQGSNPVIPRKRNSIRGNGDIDWYLYKLQHLVENMFARLKQFPAIATRYDKLKRNYSAFVALACAFICLPM